MHIMSLNHNTDVLQMLWTVIIVVMLVEKETTAKLQENCLDLVSVQLYIIHSVHHFNSYLGYKLLCHLTVTFKLQTLVKLACSCL